jgi:alpha-glucosidase
VYYGDEIGLTGGKDPGCRKSFPWDEEKWDGALRSDVKTLISLRNQHPALRTGDFIPLFGGNQVIAYCRKNQTETIVVIINNNNTDVTLGVDMKRNVPSNTNLKDLLTGKDLVVENGWLHKVDLPAKSGIILI